MIMNQVLREARLAFVGVAFLCLSVSANAQSSKQNLRQEENVRPSVSTQRQQFDAKQYLELLGATLKELQIYYVDSIDYANALQVGIDAMLEELDPYTELFSEDDQANFKTMTTGEYGGIGSLIMQRGDTVIISEPYAGNPAVEVGLRAGDAILSIDGISMVGKNTSDVSEQLRGAPGSTFRLEVLRPFESTPRFFDVVRRKILIPAVSYYTWLNDSIAFIQLDSFTDKASQEFHSAVLALREERPMKGLVLNLRGNGGGLLDEAVKILGLFLPKGSTVVQTKARLPQWNSIYKTPTEPIDTVMPIAVLVDRNTASAAEILSGALQDMDRAVVLGERSYGKGLVQSTHSLPYNALLKFTSAKYYIPSGRCIQAIDYNQRDEEGRVSRIPDSLTTVFHTAAGREVRDGGGIKPDVEMKPQTISTLSYYLRSGNYFFDYAVRYRAGHDSIAPAADFCITDADYADFTQWLQQRKFTYARMSRKKLAELREAVALEGYADIARPALDSLERQIGNDLESELSALRPEVEGLLNQEIATNYYYREGEAAQVLKTDSLVLNAVQLLSDPQRYHSLLQPAPVAEPKSAGRTTKKNKK